MACCYWERCIGYLCGLELLFTPVGWGRGWQHSATLPVINAWNWKLDDISPRQLRMLEIVGTKIAPEYRCERSGYLPALTRSLWPEVSWLNKIGGIVFPTNIWDINWNGPDRPICNNLWYHKQDVIIFIYHRQCRAWADFIECSGTYGACVTVEAWGRCFPGACPRFLHLIGRYGHLGQSGGWDQGQPFWAHQPSSCSSDVSERLFLRPDII